MLRGFSPALWLLSVLGVLAGCGARSSLDDARVTRSPGDAAVAARGPDAAADAQKVAPDSGTDARRSVPDAGTDARETGPEDAASDASDGGLDAVVLGDACVSSCVPLTCADLGATYGAASDGCGNLLDCGSCECLMAGVANTCWGAVTIPPDVWLNRECCGAVGCATVCSQIGLSCGRGPDGCGNFLECGPCNPDGSCPGGGTAGDCSPCTPRTCASAGFNCGTWDDGCGGASIDCGACDPCVPCQGGVCAGVFVSACVPKTCADLGLDCGSQTDGCGGIVDCGACPAGEPGTACVQGRCVLPCP